MAYDKKLFNSIDPIHSMIPEIRPKKMTRRYMKPSEKDEIYELVQNAPKGPQKEKYQFAQRKFVEDHYPENAKQEPDGLSRQTFNYHTASKNIYKPPLVLKKVNLAVCTFLT